MRPTYLTFKVVAGFRRLSVIASGQQPTLFTEGQYAVLRKLSLSYFLRKQRGNIFTISYSCLNLWIHMLGINFKRKYNNTLLNKLKIHTYFGKSVSLTVRYNYKEQHFGGPLQTALLM